MFFQNNLMLNLFTEDTLDSCGKNGNEYSFCKTCFSMVKKSKPTKFGSINSVNTTTCCQSYPDILTGLTPVEEAVIARAHPVVSIPKLRPGRTSPSVCYQRIRGQPVVVPQNPGPLLNLLPSTEFELHDVIRIV